MIQIIKKFNILMSKKAKKRVIKLVFLTLIGAFFEILGISLVVPMFTAIMKPDALQSNKIIHNVCQTIGITSHISFVLICIVSLIVIFIVKDVYLVYLYCTQARFIFDSRFETQKKVLHAFLSKPYEFFLNASSGEILRIINSDVTETYNLLMTLVTLITESVIAVTLVMALMVIDPVMTASLTVLLAAIIAFMGVFIKPRLKKKGEEYRDNSQATYKWMLQSVQGIKELKIARRESYFEKNFETAGIKQISAEKWNLVMYNTPRLFVEVGCVCATLSVIAGMIYFGKPMEELIPALSAFAVAAVKLMPSALHIVNMITSLAYQGPAIDNLLRSIDDLGVTSKKYIECKHSLSLIDKIEFKNIKYHYPNSDKYVINNASFEIKNGECVGIIGSSGSGKTTAVDILLGLLNPESGEIMTDGVNVMTDYADWLSHIGYIPQSIFMLDDSIKANVAFGYEPDEDEVWRALKDAQLDEFVRELPEGLDTQIGERGIRLSGGQRQRVGIARALYYNPDILVFDEATSSLDNETESAIMEAINGLHGLKTMIIIAHRLQTIENCDRVYKVKEGKITQEGLK